MSLEGQQFGEFEILERLGQGGMGAVYKARQVSIDRFVALKTLQAGLAENGEFIARFQQEAKAAGRMSHPNLVQIYAAGESEGLYWFAMEYVEGESARVRLKRLERLEPLEALAIALHVAAALEYGWRKAGLIHRDIKPDNIFLSNDGEVKLGDLGLAKSAGQTSGITTTGHSMGTPYYISPEQVEDMKEVDLRSDIYSLGCTLFHLVSGKPPFDGSSGSTIMLKHITQPVPSLGEAWAECPRVLEEVVRRMMQKEPGERQQDYAAVIRDLEHAYEVVSHAPKEGAVVAAEMGVGRMEMGDAAFGNGGLRSSRADAGAPSPGLEALPMGVGPAASVVQRAGKLAERALSAVRASGRRRVWLYAGVAGMLLVVFFLRPGGKVWPKPTGIWVDVTADRQSLSMPGATIAEDGLHLDRTVMLKRPMLNGAVRVTAVYDPNHGLFALWTRDTASQGYYVQISEEQVVTYLQTHADQERRGRKAQTLKYPLEKWKEFTVELQNKDKHIAVMVNGEPVMEIFDATPVAGNFAVEPQGPMVIKKLEYRVDDVPGA